MKISIENNLTENSEIELKESSKEHSLQEEKNKDTQNNIKKDSKGDSQNNLEEEEKKSKNEKREEKKEDLIKDKIENSEIDLKEDEKSEKKNSKKEVNEKEEPIKVKNKYSKMDLEEKKRENSKKGKYDEIKEDSKEENQKMNTSANDGNNTDSCKDNINVREINNKKKSNESEDYLNLYDDNSSIIISHNNISISKDNSSLSEKNQIKNISKSYINNSQLQIALTEMEENTQKEKIHQFQFKFIKRKLGVDDCEDISGTAYEEFARKSFKIMLMIITQDDLNFENPKNFSINRFLVEYLNNSINDWLRIKTNIHNIINQGLIEDNMEIDIVTEFKYKVIEKLIKNFPKNVFFSEYIYNSENAINLDEDITLIIEIAKNIVHQGKEKLSQIIKYIAFISILNLYKESFTKMIESKPFSNICTASKISKDTRKMFCIITDGDYNILKYVFNEIIQNIFPEKFNNNDEIKDFIVEKIKVNKDITKKIEEKEMNNIEENIFNVYLMFENLKKNNIKFFVLYIGDIDQCLYQQNLFYNFISKDELKEKINYENFFKSLQIKKRLPRIKEMNRKLKHIINLFCNEMDNITNEKIKNLNLETKIKKLIKNLNFSNFMKIGNELQFTVNFILLDRDKDDSKIKIKLEDTLKKGEFPAIKYYEIKTSQIVSFMTGYQKTLNSLINPKLFVIYVMKIDFNEKEDKELYDFFFSQKSDNFLSNNVKYLIYTKDQNNNIQLDEEKSNFQNILDKKTVNIDDKISNFLNNYKKNVKYIKTRTDKFENFNKENLISKLEDELLSIFNLQKEIPFDKEIKEYNYSIDKIQYQKLLKFFSQATELVEKDIKLFNQEDKSLKTFLCNKLNNLSQNIVCRKIYGFVYYEIFDAIKNDIYNSVKTQFSYLMELLK